MSTKRLTVSLPSYLYDMIKREVPERQISGVVTCMLEEGMYAKKCYVKESKVRAVDRFLSWRGKLPKKTAKQITEAIRKGRM